MNQKSIGDPSPGPKFQALLPSFGAAPTPCALLLPKQAFCGLLQPPPQGAAPLMIHVPEQHGHLPCPVHCQIEGEAHCSVTEAPGQKDPTNSDGWIPVWQPSVPISNKGKCTPFYNPNVARMSRQCV